MVQIKSDIFHVSEESWCGLLAQARAGHFVTSYKMARGLSLYLAYVASVGMVDSRPDYVRDSDLERLQADLLPYWLPEFVRMHRRLSIDAATRRKLIAIARQYGIANYRVDSLRRGNSLISAVLEALGAGWLTPKKAVSYVRGSALRHQRQIHNTAKHLGAARPRLT